MDNPLMEDWEVLVLEAMERLSIENLKTYLSHWLPFLASPAEQLKLKAVTEDSLPPIHRLPEEILTMIFATELPSTDEDYVPCIPKRPRRSLVTGNKLNPTILGEVCRHWRAVTLFNPLLWSSMDILCNLEESTLPLLTLWLERSGGVPLNITFTETTCDIKDDRDVWRYPPKNPRTPAVMELLVAHAHRWRSIDFQFSYQISDVLLNAPSESFKILESAMLRSRKATNVRFDGLPPLVKAWDLFHASPKLHKVQYELEFADRYLDDIPWSRLTSIDVIIRLEDLFKVLPQCPNLTELIYTDPLARYVSEALPRRKARLGPPEPLPHIKVPKLRRLWMTVTFAPNDMFDHLTLPSLESIHWRQNNVWLLNPVPQAFVNLLMRSHCPLKRFSYRALGGPQGEEVLGHILGSPAMSSVEEVTAEVRLSDNFSNIMTTGSRRLALPNIQVLTFIRCKMSSGVLGNMISNMKRDRNSFRIFNSEFWPRHEEDRATFERLRKEGMRIVD
ncbi:hypothetical protein H0H92_003990 [Tricholoma furcatifolium]|nr:hypothetical protein H0H92_003990 [Tricholoma furcatifolium]